MSYEFSKSASWMQNRGGADGFCHQDCTDTVLSPVFPVGRCFAGIGNLDWEASGADHRQEKDKRN